MDLMRRPKTTAVLETLRIQHSQDPASILQVAPISACLQTIRAKKGELALASQTLDRAIVRSCGCESS
jgi:hypothetical protein